MSARSRRWGTAAVGAGFIALVLGLSSLGVAYGFGVFSSSKAVTAVLPEAGPALGTGAEVQYRGVLVGSVGDIHRTLSDAILTLRIDPSQVDRIPAGVTVRLVPRSVFGDLYVDLVPPAQSAGHLQPGARLVADTSSPTVELDQALAAGYRLLTAVRPSKLDATLTAISTALDGRGATLGRLIDQLDHYTSQLAPHTGRLVRDIATVAVVGRELSADAPDLLRILDDAVATSRTIAATQPDVRRLLAGGPGVSDRARALLAGNRVRLRTLLRQLEPVIGVLGHHRHDLVVTVRQLRAFLDGAAGALGHGPYLKVAVTPDANGKHGRQYTARNCPRYPGMAGPNCPGSAHRAHRRQP